MICYLDIEADYWPLPEETTVDCAQMARAFLLYILEAYLFDNGGQTVSLRWLALFRDFGATRGANWGQACLAYLYLCLDILNQGHLRQLMRPWKLMEVSFFLSLSFSFYSSCKCKRKLQSMFLQTIFILSLCHVNYHLANYIHLYAVILANCIHLYTVFLQTIFMLPFSLFSAGLFNMVLSFQG